jgi:hypothetical protein
MPTAIPQRMRATKSPTRSDQKMKMSALRGDLRDGFEAGVVAADVDGRQSLGAQQEAEDLTVDVAVRVTIAVERPVHRR